MVASYKVFLLAALLHLHIALNCSLREVKSISPPWRRPSELKNGGTRSRAKQYLHPTKYKVSFQQRNTFFTLQNMIKIWNTKGRTENTICMYCKIQFTFLFGSNWISLQYQSHLFTDKLSQRKSHDATKRQVYINDNLNWTAYTIVLFS